MLGGGVSLGMVVGYSFCKMLSFSYRRFFRTCYVSCSSCQIYLLTWLVRGLFQILLSLFPTKK